VRGLLLPFLIALPLMQACGRIGFDLARDDGADDVAAPSDGAAPDDATDLGDAADLADAAACGWQLCGAGLQACCVGSLGMCVVAGTCTGAVYACDGSTEGRCSATQQCCMLSSGGSVCINLDTVCDPTPPD
jgi:hypothetical protein